MLRGVVELNAGKQAVGRRHPEHLLEALAEMGIEAVWNKVDLARLAVTTVEQPQDEADEIGILSHQCLARRGVEKVALAAEVAAWQKRRNAARCGIDWTFTRRDADRKMRRHYVS